MAGRLQEILFPSQIALDLKSTKHLDALNEVAGLLKGNPDVAGFSGFYEQLLLRDRQDTTCLGNDLAIPHARTEHVRRIVLAVGRSTHGVYFENSRQTARLLFALGTPIDQPMEYLKLVSVLCKILKVDTNRAALLSAATAEDFIRILVEAESRIAAPAAR